MALNGVSPVFLGKHGHHTEDEPDCVCTVLLECLHHHLDIHLKSTAKRLCNYDHNKVPVVYENNGHLFHGYGERARDRNIDIV